MKKKCLNCGEEVRGRMDKKFCSSECRNEFNNERYRKKNAEIYRINKILKKNRAILENLNPDGKRLISKKRLLSEGFDFTYFTEIYTTKIGRVYYFCYDHGYFIDEEKDKILMVEKQPYEHKKMNEKNK